VNVISRAPRYWLIALAAYLGYLGLARIFGQTGWLQVTGACFALTLIFSICVLIGEAGFVRRRLAALGRYSLVAYIFQIAVLQAYGRFHRAYDPGSLAFVTEMLALLFLMVATIEALEWLRMRSRAADGAYRAVFA
jgi:uncharacterized membrane protein YhaH (DUF805 family)